MCSFSEPVFHIHLIWLHQSLEVADLCSEWKTHFFIFALTSKTRQRNSDCGLMNIAYRRSFRVMCTSGLRDGLYQSRVGLIVSWQISHLLLFIFALKVSHLGKMNICRKYYIVEALMMAPHPPGGPKREQIKNVHRLWSLQLICAVNWKEAAQSPMFSWFSSTKSKLQCGVPSCAQGPVKPCPAPVTSLYPRVSQRLPD